MKRFNCGDRVYDRCDPRHVGRVMATDWDGIIIVKWIETGWVSDLHPDSLALVPKHMED